MPPKSSNLIHVTFHIQKSAILLSVPSSSTINSLKSQLIPALQPLSSTLPKSIPKSPSDIQLWEYKDAIEGQDPSQDKQIHNLESASGVGGKSIASLGWERWKTVFISLKDAEGEFSKPVYTIPDVEDEDPDGSEAQ
ncbi:uncharacterized protein I303_107110 [Kwoniella dejecticola CBS 10117]|uniref:Uncharacterized protein n=1 Tax=Kwoniella dejecticola CBS 10117 TaxID=1296121 RepID=A0AAJ8KVA1_9TREE